VLAAITVVAANNDVGWRAVVLTLAYALGAAIPMLAIAYGGRGLAGRLRSHAEGLRLVSGILIALVALGIAFNQDERFQTALPGYTSALQKHVEDSATAQRELAKIRPGGGKTLVAKAKPAASASASAPGLPDYGLAPALSKTGHWFNSPPLTLKKLRGKVVLIDFWTYSCINCLRTLPHLESWYATYKPAGLVVLGVHTPEFAFEHVTSNVGAAVKRLGIKYPVVQDNDFGTWNAYSNQYWPAEYLIDRTGHVRHVHFGESSYGETESLIRRLLGDDGAMARHVVDTTPLDASTPESYLGYLRLDKTRYEGSPIRKDRSATYELAGSLPQNGISYGGQWRIGAERIVAGPAARLRLHYLGRHVYLVLGGKGRVDVLVNGKPTRTVDVDSYKLYSLRDSAANEDATMELRFTPGVQAYAFTFG
jgi:thiol-disulfide isomerase/thioredoxin